MKTKWLIYYVVGCDSNYIELPKFSIFTLLLNSDISNIDILVLCDDEYSKIVKHHLPFVNIHITKSTIS